MHIGLKTHQQSESYKIMCLMISSISSSPIGSRCPSFSSGTNSHHHMSIPVTTTPVETPATTHQPEPNKDQPNTTSQELPDNWLSLSLQGTGQEEVTHQTNHQSHPIHVLWDESSKTIFEPHLTRALLAHVSTIRATAKTLGSIRSCMDLLPEVPTTPTGTRVLARLITNMLSKGAQELRQLHELKGPTATGLSFSKTIRDLLFKVSVLALPSRLQFTVLVEEIVTAQPNNVVPFPVSRSNPKSNKCHNGTCVCVSESVQSRLESEYVRIRSNIFPKYSHKYVRVPCH